MVFLTGLLNNINSHMIKVLNNNCFKFLLLGSVNIMLLWRIPVIEYTYMVYYHNHFAFSLLSAAWVSRVMHCSKFLTSFLPSPKTAKFTLFKFQKIIIIRYLKHNGKL